MHQNIKPPVNSPRLRHHPIAIRPDGGIADDIGSRPARGGDFLNHLLPVGFGPHCDDDLRALGREEFGRGLGDTGAGADEQRNAIVEFPHDASPC